MIFYRFSLLISSIDIAFMSRRFEYCVFAIAAIIIAGSLIMITNSSMTKKLAVAQEELEQEQAFTAELSGTQELPPVNTNAAGLVNITGNNQSIAYRLALSNMTNATAAHIHMGEEEENGKVVVTLYKSESPTSGVEIESLAGNITADKLQGPLADTTLVELFSIMDSGTAYVNVHSVDFPNGEVRGELSPQNEEEEGVEEEEE